MLPYFVRRDFSDVLSYLRDSGYDLEESWFGSHMEFRFPKIGSIEVGSIAGAVQIELREALEPWNVLAEETISGRTSRTVDSSFERIQVKLTGLTAESRYVVTCNARRVPLRPTGEAGETVAGVRYRARQLSAVLHPTIPVHAPLAFEVIDRWKQQSAGRCTYYVNAPDGQPYTSRPVNAEQAAERRHQRFQESVPTPGPMAIPKEEDNPSFPMTLDLRFVPPQQSNESDTPGLVP
jgi:uncharacterized protein (DUF2126 family)